MGWKVNLEGEAARTLRDIAEAVVQEDATLKSVTLKLAEAIDRQTTIMEKAVDRQTEAMKASVDRLTAVLLLVVEDDSSRLAELEARLRSAAEKLRAATTGVATPQQGG